jgi:hypothetical protein
MNPGPVYIVGDDPDDQDLINEAWKELGYENALKFFKW